MTRGSSWMRVTVISNSRVDSHGSVKPVIGAALVGIAACRERNVALPGEQPRGRVEPDPAGTGHVHLGPGVQVGEVGRRSRRGRRAACTSGDELDEVAGHEARGEAEVAQHLHQQPARVAARAAPRARSVSSGVWTPGSMRTRYVTSLCTPLVERDQEVDGVDARLEPPRRNPSSHSRAAGRRLLLAGRARARWRAARVGEREALGVRARRRSRTG